MKKPVKKIVLGLGVAVVAAVAAVVVVGGRDDGVVDEPSGAIDVEADPDFTISDRAVDHRIVYRVTGSDGSIETDRLVVRSPFDSRLESAGGAPPGGETTSVQIGTIARLAIGGTSDPATVARIPGLAPSTIRIAPVIEMAEELGLLEVHGQRMVAGRRCEVLRSGSTLAAGPLRPITGGEYVDSCVDADGLLLEETLFVDGELSFRRTAVEVDVDPAFDEDEFAVGDPTAPVDQGGGDASPADPTSAPIGRFHVLPDDAVPGGYELLERYSVIPPQPDRFADPMMRDGIIAGVADVYVRDDDFFVIYQGATLGQVRAFAPTAFAHRIEVGPLGDAELLLSARGSEVRVVLGGGRFVHVIGPLEPERLVEVTTSLVEIEGEGLVLLED